MARYVLDTSAIMAVLFDEEGALDVLALLRMGELVAMPFLALMEVEYKLIGRFDGRPAERMALLLNWPVQVYESDPGWRREAARVKAAGRISLADSWMAALALLHDAELVHKDPEFESVPGLKMIKLPYDRDAQRSST